MVEYIESFEIKTKNPEFLKMAEENLNENSENNDELFSELKQDHFVSPKIDKDKKLYEENKTYTNFSSNKKTNINKNIYHNESKNIKDYNLKNINNDTNEDNVTMNLKKSKIKESQKKTKRVENISKRKPLKEEICEDDESANFKIQVMQSSRHIFKEEGDQSLNLDSYELSKKNSNLNRNRKSQSKSSMTGIKERNIRTIQKEAKELKDLKEYPNKPDKDQAKDRNIRRSPEPTSYFIFCPTISENSKKIVMDSIFLKKEYNVYDRLYYESQGKVDGRTQTLKSYLSPKASVGNFEMLKLESRLSNKRIQRSRSMNAEESKEIEIHEKLYECGMKQKTDQLKSSKRYLEKCWLEEIKDLKSKPSINENSEIIFDSLSYRKNCPDLFEFEKEFKKRKMLNIERMRINEFSELKNKAPFSPSINKKSAELCKQRGNTKKLSPRKNNNLRDEDTDSFNYLYNDYKVRMENMKELIKIHRDKECSFIPNIRINTKKANMNSLESLSFANRMEAKGLLPLNTKTKIAQTQNTAPEVNSTPPTLKPSYVKIKKQDSRSPIKIKNEMKRNSIILGSEASNIKKHENSNLPLKRKSKEEEEKENEKEEKKNIKITTLKSEKMIEKMKEVAFEKIYTILDSLNIGKIDFSKADQMKDLNSNSDSDSNPNLNLILGLKNLETKLGSASKAFLNMLKNLPNPINKINKINKSEFFEACFKVYSKLSVTERNTILRFGKSKSKFKNGKASGDSPTKKIKKYFEVKINSQQLIKTHKG